MLTGLRESCSLVQEPVPVPVQTWALGPWSHCWGQGPSGPLFLTPKSEPQKEHRSHCPGCGHLDMALDLPQPLGHQSEEGQAMEWEGPGSSMTSLCH